MAQTARRRLGRVDLTFGFSWGWWLLGISFRRKKWALGGRQGKRFIVAHDYRLTVGLLPFVYVEGNWAGKIHNLSAKQMGAIHKNQAKGS